MASAQLLIAVCFLKKKLSTNGHQGKSLGWLVRAELFDFLLASRCSRGKSKDQASQKDFPHKIFVLLGLGQARSPTFTFHRPFAVHFTFGGKRNVDGKKEMSCELGLEQDLPEQRFV